MAEPFVGEIKMVGFNFAPQGWAGCDGALLSIQQNSALFSLLGTTYGGDGRVTFGLPDMRGRVPIHFGQGPGLTPYSEGDRGGVEGVAITGAQMPQHNHTLLGTPTAGNTRAPAGATLAREAAGQTAVYSNATPSVDAAFNPQSISLAGGNQPHENRQPFLAVNFVIALVGIYPPRS